MMGGVFDYENSSKVLQGSPKVLEDLFGMDQTNDNTRRWMWMWMCMCMCMWMWMLMWKWIWTRTLTWTWTWTWMEMRMRDGERQGMLLLPQIIFDWHRNSHNMTRQHPPITKKCQTCNHKLKMREHVDFFSLPRSLPPSLSASFLDSHGLSMDTMTHAWISTEG